MNKLAWSALILCVLSVLAISARSQSNDAPPDAAGPRAEVTQTPGDADKAKPADKTIDGIRAELQRLSTDAKTNTDKIAQIVMLRSDLLKLIQDSKAGSEKTSQIMLDQIDALRADQVKFINEAKAQVEALKADSARSTALAQRVEGIRKELDELKENVPEIPPGLAIIIALAALVLGPLVARQLTANQLAAAAKKQAAAAAVRPEADTPTPTGKTADEEIPLAPPVAAEPTVAHHDEPVAEEPASSRQPSTSVAGTSLAGPRHDASAEAEDEKV